VKEKRNNGIDGRNGRHGNGLGLGTSLLELMGLGGEIEAASLREND
jgi:hypothetical protein